MSTEGAAATPVVHAERLFDGTRWREDVTVFATDGLVAEVRKGRHDRVRTVAMVIPGLVDAGVVAEGYFDGPADDVDPYRPERSFVHLCLAHGVTSVVDVGASTAPARALVGCARINAVAALGRIAEVPTRRGDLSVEADGVAGLVDALAQAGAALVSWGLWPGGEPRLDPQPGRSVVRNRHHSRTPIPGFAVCSPEGEEYRAPQALASSRWTVEGMLASGDATDGRAFLPYLRNFRGGGNFMSRRIARDVLSRLYGARRERDLGDWAHQVLESSPERLLAASGAGTGGVLPGGGLWEELAMIEQAAGFDAALRAATGHPARAFPALGAGRVSPGQRCDLLLIEAAAASIAALRAGWRAAIVLGEDIDVEAEWSKVRAECDAADGRGL